MRVLRNSLSRVKSVAHSHKVKQIKYKGQAKDG